MEKSKALRIAAVFLFIFVILGFLLYAVQNGFFIRSDSKESKLQESLEPAAPSPEIINNETGTPIDKSPNKEPARPEPKMPALPQVATDSWELRLANYENNIGDYIPELVVVENNQKFDARAADALKEWLAAARAEGLAVYFSSGYRNYYYQQYLYLRKVAEYGEKKAKTIVAPPGHSEHQLGLAADITDTYYEVKKSSLEHTALFKWLNSTCQDYGFILRYPKDKTEITKIIYEPWHFRYVGLEPAKYMKENNLCLEEFIDLYKHPEGFSGFLN
ncbi:MAG: M15 family metallopeptidase [Clostridiales bacterium]|nr:M15 family metallopeptidase [Clostridiales bacterium]